MRGVIRIILLSVVTGCSFVSAKDSPELICMNFINELMEGNLSVALKRVEEQDLKKSQNRIVKVLPKAVYDFDKKFLKQLEVSTIEEAGMLSAIEFWTKALPLVLLHDFSKPIKHLKFTIVDLVEKDLHHVVVSRENTYLEKEPKWIIIDLKNVEDEWVIICEVFPEVIYEILY